MESTRSEKPFYEINGIENVGEKFEISSKTISTDENNQLWESGSSFAALEKEEFANYINLSNAATQQYFYIFYHANDAEALTHINNCINVLAPTLENTTNQKNQLIAYAQISQSSEDKTVVDINKLRKSQADNIVNVTTSIAETIANISAPFIGNKNFIQAAKNWYAAIFQPALKAMNEKAEKLEKYDYKEVIEAKELVTNLQNHWDAFAQSKTKAEHYPVFEKACQKELKKCEGTFKKHPIWKKLLANISAALVSLVLFYPIVLLLQKKWSGNYFFLNETGTRDKFDHLKTAIESVPKLSK